MSISIIPDNKKIRRLGPIYSVVYLFYIDRITETGVIITDEVSCPKEVVEQLIEDGYFLSIGPSSPDSYWIRISREFIDESGSWSNIKK